MNDELKGISNKLKRISHKLDKMRQEHSRDKYENIGYILAGFTLAMVGLTAANPAPAGIGVTIGFFILTCVVMLHPGSIKAKQDVGKQRAIGVKRRLIRLARWFEWVFGIVLMTSITVIVSLQYLDGYGRVLLLIGPGIFFIATLISQFDQAGWFDRRGGE